MRLVKFLIAASGVLFITGLVERLIFNEVLPALVCMSLGYLTLLHALNLYEMKRS